MNDNDIEIRRIIYAKNETFDIIKKRSNSVGVPRTKREIAKVGFR